MQSNLRIKFRTLKTCAYLVEGTEALPFWIYRDTFFIEISISLDIIVIILRCVSWQICVCAIMCQNHSCVHSWSFSGGRDTYIRAFLKCAAEAKWCCCGSVSGMRNPHPYPSHNLHDQQTRVDTLRIKFFPSFQVLIALTGRPPTRALVHHHCQNSLELRYIPSVSEIPE